jgi:hypothetical protein
MAKAILLIFFSLPYIFNYLNCIGTILLAIMTLNFVISYQKEPELLLGNDALWTFVNFAGEDHTNFQTLVAFLNMLSTLVLKSSIILKLIS